MRDIKFKIFSRRTKTLTGPFGIISAGYQIRELNEQPENILFFQCTGIKDSQGVDIYDYDIISYEHLDGSESLFSVSYCAARGAFIASNKVDVFTLGAAVHCKILVIGSAATNPELMP